MSHEADFKVYYRISVLPQVVIHFSACISYINFYLSLGADLLSTFTRIQTKYLPFFLYFHLQLSRPPKKKHTQQQLFKVVGGFFFILTLTLYVIKLKF